MHAAMAYINGAGARRIGKRRSGGTDLALLKTLLSAPGESSTGRGKGKSKVPMHSNEANGYSKKIHKKNSR
jgi:hypothetical protein